MLRWLFILLAAFSSLACGDSQPRQENAHAADAPGQGHADPPKRVSDGPGARFAVAGMEFVAPENWVPVKPSSSMRQASFEFGPVGTDEEKAEMHVFYFGPGDGGDVDANVQRWLSQMQPATGASASEAAERSMFTAAGYPVHMVRADGSFAQSMGPADAHGGSKPGWRLVGAILEGAQGNLFFKITGPQATVRAMEPGLEAMLSAVNKVRE